MKNRKSKTANVLIFLLASVSCLLTPAIGQQVTSSTPLNYQPYNNALPLFVLQPSPVQTGDAQDWVNHTLQTSSLGTGDGSTILFSGTLSVTNKILQRSVTVTAGSVVGVDDGLGSIKGSGLTGTINYSTGALSVTYVFPPPGTTPVNVTFFNVACSVDNNGIMHGCGSSPFTGVNWYANSSFVSTEPGGNFIAGSGITISAVDNPGAQRADYTFSGICSNGSTVIGPDTDVCASTNFAAWDTDSYGITAVVSGAGGTFTVAGDQTAYFSGTLTFTVTGSTCNDGVYGKVSAVFSGGNTVVTTTSVPCGTADGYLTSWASDQLTRSFSAGAYSIGQGNTIPYAAMIAGGGIGGGEGPVEILGIRNSLINENDVYNVNIVGDENTVSNQSGSVHAFGYKNILQGSSVLAVGENNQVQNANAESIYQFGDTNIVFGDCDECMMIGQNNNVDAGATQTGLLGYGNVAESSVDDAFAFGELNHIYDFSYAFGVANETHGGSYAFGNNNLAVDDCTILASEDICPAAGLYLGYNSAPANAPEIAIQTGTVTINGDFMVTGTKAAVVPMPNGTRAAMYAIESPMNWFEDFGSAVLSNGVATVSIPADFSATVTLGAGYSVFVTPNGDCNGLYVTKDAASFTVHELKAGTSSVAFDWRVIAHRAGHETERMLTTAQIAQTHATKRPPATLASVTPNHAATGDTVTIAGGGLLHTQILLGAKLCRRTSESATEVACTVPRGAGAVDVTVRAPGSGRVILKNAFTYDAAPKKKAQ